MIHEMVDTPLPFSEEKEGPTPPPAEQEPMKKEEEE